MPFPGPSRRPPQPSAGAPGSLRFRLAATTRDEILAACRAALPNEGCGLLLGHRDQRAAMVLEALPARNVLASPQQYEIEPEAVLAADRAARASGRMLLGAWHSHPGGAPVPSAQDRAEAWPDWCYLVVGLADPAAPELRAWRLLGERFVEDLLEIA